MMPGAQWYTSLLLATALSGLGCTTAFSSSFYAQGLDRHGLSRSSHAIIAPHQKGRRVFSVRSQRATSLLRMQEQDLQDASGEQAGVGSSNAKGVFDSEDHWSPTVSWFQYTWLLAILPALSEVFPAIVSAAQQASVPEDRRLLVILFLLLKRIYLYSCALSIVDVAARRSVGASPALGQRIQTLNKELLGGVVSEAQFESLAESKEAKELYSEMDKVDSGAQAIFLPRRRVGLTGVPRCLSAVGGVLLRQVFLALVLGSSYLAVQLFSNAPPPPPGASVSSGQILRSVSALSNAGICLLFTRTELLEALKTFQRRFGGDQQSTETAAGAEGSGDEKLSRVALGLSAVAVGGCYLGPASWVWPLRNVVSSCLAVTVARAVQLPRLSLVVAALGGLMLYDGVGVNGPLLALPAGAAEAAASTSVMETVARAKLEGGWWQPGLLSVVVGGKVTDALGLADTVFPALLAGWAMRHDQREARSLSPSRRPELPRASSYSRAALGGYAVGCFSMEVFQGSGGGQAALLYIVPAMLGAVGVTAALRGELAGAIWDAPEERAAGE